MWYLQRNNTVIGPVSEKVVVENWYNGKIEQSDLISFDKLNWNRFDKCGSFSHLFPKVPNLQKYQGVSNEITSRSVKNTFGNFISEGLYAGKQYQLGIDFGEIMFIKQNIREKNILMMHLIHTQNKVLGFLLNL